MDSKSFRIAILASGSGSNFESICVACQSGRLQSTVQLLVASKESLPVIERAEKLSVPTIVCNPRQFKSTIDWESSILKALKEYKVDLIFLAGFLHKIGPILLQAYDGRILNTHPSLLPKYGGQGLFGRRVHEEVLKAKEKETGITVHQVDQEYDHGAVIAQTPVSVLATDTVESLSDRIRKRENEFVVEVLASIEAGSYPLK